MHAGLGVGVDSGQVWAYIGKAWANMDGYGWVRLNGRDE